MPIEYIKNKLATVRGHLVEAQMDFLKDEKMWTSDDSIDWRGLNPVRPFIFYDCFVTCRRTHRLDRRCQSTSKKE